MSNWKQIGNNLFDNIHESRRFILWFVDFFFGYNRKWQITFPPQFNSCLLRQLESPLVKNYECFNMITFLVPALSLCFSQKRWWVCLYGDQETNTKSRSIFVQSFIHSLNTKSNKKILQIIEHSHGLHDDNLDFDYSMVLCKKNL